MTVESINNKQTAQQMGASSYPFTLEILLKDPTADEAKAAIKAKVKEADGTEIDLVYNSSAEDGYSVSLDTDGSGGTVTVVTQRTSSDYITIYREYTLKQEADYQDFNAAPANTFEQCFDKLTMIEQQQQEEIDRCVKVNMTSGTDPEVFAEKVERIYESVDNIDTVADISTDVETVADNDTNISTVAGISTDITTVSGIATDVPTVADNDTNISTVATNITDVNTCATNIADIQSASTNAATAKQYAIGVPTEPAEGSAKYWAEQAAQGQIQADWTQSDSTQKDFIKNKPVLTTHSITLGTVWNGTAAPYTQDVSIVGITSSDNPVIGLVKSDTWSVLEEQEDEYSKIKRAVTSTNKITFYAEDKTTMSLSLQVKVIR